MARIETWLDCDLKKIIRVHEIKGNVFTQDHLGNLIGVRVYDDGEPVTLAGSVNGYCILADGSTVPVDGDRDTSGNRAWIILPQSAYAVPGTIRITIKLTETDGDDVDHIVTLASLVGTVTRSKTDNMVTPSSQVITDWSQQISAEMQEVSDAAAAAAGNFAAAYSTTKTYSVGEYVTYNGALYRCTTAVTTAGSWSSNSAKFAAVKMGNDVADLKSAIDSTETYGLAHEMITLPFTIDRDGYISINTGKRSDSTESSITHFINIEGCDKITYKRQGTTLSSTVVAGIAFYRANDPDTFISGVKSATGKSQKGYLSEPYTVEVPSGAKYVRFTTYTDTGTYGFFEASVQGALYTTDLMIGEIDRKSLIYRGLLDENDDMNSLENAGVYLVKNHGTAHPPVNFPSLSGEFRILVIKNVTNLSHHGAEAQLVFFSGGIMYRRCDRNGETWSAWKTIYAVESETESDPLYELSKQLGLHTVPKNYGVLNAIRRARQLTDVKWTPDFDITRIFVGMRDSLSDPHGAAYYGLFKSDTEYKGAPYHSGAKYIGIDAPIDAFITSAENINSVIGTGQSESSPADRLSYYGTACDTLVSYVYYLPHVQAGYFETLNGLSLIATISANFDYSKIELADLLFSTSHVAIISDIVKDENGNVIYIEVSDAARSASITQILSCSAPSSASSWP